MYPLSQEPLEREDGVWGVALWESGLKGMTSVVAVGPQHQVMGMGMAVVTDHTHWDSGSSLQTEACCVEGRGARQWPGTEQGPGPQEVHTGPLRDRQHGHPVSRHPS